jgi:hypothetical protein
MDTVKSEQAKGLTLERRRRRQEEEMMMMEVVVAMMMCRPTYVYQGLNDDSTIIACSFIQVPSFQRNLLPLSSRFMTQNALIEKSIHSPLIAIPHKYTWECRK